MTFYPLEASPTLGQKARLEAWLRDLTMICRQHGFFLDTDEDAMAVVDLQSRTTIGIDLMTILTGEPPEEEVDICCSGSILDGVWFVDTATGPTEQWRLLTKEKP